jgi:hypothetical protein
MTVRVEQIPTIMKGEQKEGSGRDVVNVGWVWLDATKSTQSITDRGPRRWLLQ